MREKSGKSSLKGLELTDGRHDFSMQLLKSTAQGRPTIDFLADTLPHVLNVSGSDAIELWLIEGEEVFRCESSRVRGKASEFRIIPEAARSGLEILKSMNGGRLDSIGKTESHRQGGAFCSYTKNGSVWFSDIRQTLPREADQRFKSLVDGLRGENKYRSLFLIPLHFGDSQIGGLLCKHKRKITFNIERAVYLETVSAKFELALLHQLSQARLQERVKELTCLSGIAQIRSVRELSLAQKLQNIVMLLPPAWQYPAHAHARITVDGESFHTENFREGTSRQVSLISAGGRDRGNVEVHYPDALQLLQENPFLAEEESLIENIAGQVAYMIEHQESERAKAEIHSQLIRADRLAAIGQLAAGVAHELNEPLNTILGFAQLVEKTPDMPSSVYKDLKKITEASLHARKIIRELLIFARQTTPSRTRFSLNRIIEEELILFESLCGNSGVVITRVLDPGLPDIVADKSQILQVISNLVVNSLQAMPRGGVLTLRTDSLGQAVCLVVEDTGTGM
ncbi:MAG: histidine kinase dimerization/phospho-acceptor domain-containing protein, partial [Syntrophales bacterium]|nr:histidine kinase dimerization/phospho-acceptor domain-containing protein [Syntrophales bacterium]